MNTEMDLGELVLMFISGVTFLFTAYRWVVVARIAGRVRSRAWPFLIITPLIGLALVGYVLDRWADDELRDDARYISVLFLLAAGWMGMVSTVLHWFGVSLRKDVSERTNAAAGWAWSGTLLGVIVLYCGGNIGEGPSLWNNIFSAGMGTAAILAMWVVLEWTARISHSLTVDRDLASGLRLGGFMVASGLVLGRALADDWHSAADTASDLVRQGGITAPLLVLAVIVEFVARPTARKPRRSWFGCGILPAALYLAVASVWVKWLGPWT